MKKQNNYKNIFIILISLLGIFSFKINVFANDNVVLHNSSCSGVTKGTPFNSNGQYYKTALSSCENDFSQKEGSGGMYACNEREAPYIAPYVHVIPNQTGKRIKGYIYIFQRMDAWANSSGSWNTMSNLGVSVCPDMSLKYDSAMSLDESFLKQYKNMVVLSAEKLMLDSSSIPNENGELTFLKNWSVSDYTIKEINTPTLTDSNGDATNTSVKININISKLSTNSQYGLGFNGANGYLCEPDASGNCTKNPRALHYYIPIQINVEFDNEEYEPNPCKETINGVTSDRYAYQNPGACCEEYPETCCNDVAYIESIKNSRPDVYNFCCYDTPTGTAYYGTSVTKGLPMLKTFRGYYLSEYNTKFYSNNPTIEGICKTCYEEGGYYIYEVEGTYYQSSCCQNGPYKELYKDTNCKLPTCSETSNQCSSSDDYFEENFGCCCSLYPEDERCDVGTWEENFNNYGLSCKVSPSEASNGTYAVATGSKTTNGNTISENITFTSYDTLEKMKSNIIKAGTGFKYDVKVRHRITKTAKRQYSTSCVNDPECAKAQAKQQINNFLQLTTSEINAINDTSTKFDFVAGDQEEDYVLQDGTTPSPNPVQPTKEGQISASYTVCVPTPYGPYCYTDLAKFDYDYQKTYNYTYNINLKNKYINKLQNINSEATNIIDYKNSSVEKNYIDGDTKFYTKTTTSTGIYDFNIKLNGASGVTGNLSNHDNGFVCQYGVVNQIRKDGKFDYSDPGNPTPTIDSDGRGFYFRQISLSDPFPNNRILSDTNNWFKYYDKDIGVAKYITHSGKLDSYGSEGNKKADKVYTTDNEPMYEVTLDSSLINSIKQYNKDNNYDYGWSGMESKVTGDFAPTSSFIDRFESYITIRSDIKDQREIKVGDFE